MSTGPDEFDPIDGALSGKLREIHPPADLRRRLVALAPAEKVPAWLGWMRYGWFTLAALIFAGVIIATQVHKRSASLDAARIDLTTFVSNPFTLDEETPRMENIKQWFQSRNPGGRLSVPAGLTDMTPLGCRAMEWHGIRASLVCFNIGGPQPAHLFVFPKTAFGSQVSSSPDMATDRGWTSTAWTDGTFDYVMLSPGGTEEAHRLLAMGSGFLRLAKFARAESGGVAKAL